MGVFEYLVIFGVLFAVVWLGSMWLSTRGADPRYAHLMSEFFGKMDVEPAEWLGATDSKTRNAEAEIRLLKERVAALEAIVTDRRYRFDDELERN